MDYFILGKSLPHTLSPDIHKEFGLNYGAIEIEEDMLKAFVLSKNFKGFNVTIPYKEKILPFLDVADCEAQKIGAVNTVLLKGGKLYGYNTDAGGMERALSRANINLKGKTVCILGSGGTAKTARFVAQRLGARRIFNVGRTGEINYQNVYENADTEIIINTTPVGMYPDIEGRPVDLSGFPKLSGVFDAVYNPLKTSLILQAEELKTNASGGLFMLVEQARLSYSIFSGAKSGEDLSEKVFNKLLYLRKNIVLCGMPGSGKTTVGALVASRLNRPFYDTDNLIEKKAGLAVSEIFEKYGEAAFRKMETEIISEVSRVTGAVIATGGGTLADPKNRENLLKNGLGAYIKRDLALLERKGRPLSKDDDALKALLFARGPVYENFSALKINNENAQDAAEEIIREYEKAFSY